MRTTLADRCRYPIVGVVLLCTLGSMLPACGSNTPSGMSPQQFTARWEKLRKDSGEIVGAPTSAVFAVFGPPDDKMLIAGRWLWAEWNLADGLARITFGGRGGRLAIACSAQTHAEIAAEEVRDKRRQEARARSDEEDRLRRAAEAKRRDEALKAERDAKEKAKQARREAEERARVERVQGGIERAKANLIGAFRARSHYIRYLRELYKDRDAWATDKDVAYMLSFAEGGKVEAALVVRGRLLGTGIGTWRLKSAPPLGTSGIAEFGVQLQSKPNSPSRTGVPPSGDMRVYVEHDGSRITMSEVRRDDRRVGGGVPTFAFSPIPLEVMKNMVGAARLRGKDAPKPVAEPAAEPTVDKPIPKDEPAAKSEKPKEVSPEEIPGKYVPDEESARTLKQKFKGSVTYHLTLKKNGTFKTYTKAPRRKSVRTSGSWSWDGSRLTLQATRTNGKKMRRPKTESMPFDGLRLDMNGVILQKKP